MHYNPELVPLSMQLSDIEDPNASFSIKEESPDEALWTSSPVEPVGEFELLLNRDVPISSGGRYSDRGLPHETATSQPL